MAGTSSGVYPNETRYSRRLPNRLATYVKVHHASSCVSDRIAANV